jgi:hypothetical protein
MRIQPRSVNGNDEKKEITVLRNLKKIKEYKMASSSRDDKIKIQKKKKKFKNSKKY